MNNKKLIIRDMSIRYLSTGAAVENFSMELAQGSVVAVVGESGSGKSTVTKAVLGLLDQDAVHISGHIFLRNKDILFMTDRQRQYINGREIGYIMQNAMTSLNPFMTIKAHFYESLKAHLQCAKRDAYLIGVDMLIKVGLADCDRVMRCYPHQLSGGMLQRVMTALTVALKPMFIVADEPTTALDSTNQTLVTSLLSMIKKDFNCGLMLISHNMHLVDEMAEFIIVMKGGNIIETGLKEDVFSNPKTIYTRELIEGSKYI